MKSIEEIKRYYDAFHPHLVKSTMNNPRLESIKGSLVRLCHIKPSLTVLDLGCGTGVTSLYMAQNGALVTAVDLSPANIEYARQYMAHEGVEYVCADASFLEIGKTFDLICLCDVFEHIPSLRLGYLLNAIRTHSHDDTFIYLNIPDGRFIEFMHANKPESLQIVDESHNLCEIMEYFEGIDFTPYETHSRGIDCPAQYHEIIFVKKARLIQTYGSVLNNG